VRRSPNNTKKSVELKNLGSPSQLHPRDLQAGSAKKDANRREMLLSITGLVTARDTSGKGGERPSGEKNEYLSQGVGAHATQPKKAE